MSTALRLGLVGCGRLAELGYLPALGRTPGFTLAAVADPDAGRRQRLAALAGDAGRGRVPAFASATALLEEAEVDALVLASPATAHVPDARVATDAGVPVLVEKPPAPDGAGAAALAALTPAPRLGFNRRFDPALQALREQVPAAGELDLTLTLHYRRQSWGARAVHDDVLVDLGPHVVDLARWLTGAEVTEVRPLEVGHDRAAVDLLLTRGRATLRMAADRLHLEEVAVRRPDGSTVARHRTGGPVAAVTGRLRRGPHPLVTSLAAQLAAFAGSVDGSPEPDLGTATDGVAVMTVLDAARTGGPVALTPTGA